MPRHRQNTDAHRAGAALRRLVDLTAHRTGAALVLMNEAAVTLPQVLLMSRVEQFGAASLAVLAEESSASLPALSQMVDRLVQQGLLTRAEDPVDRRRKAIGIAPRASALLRKIESARSADYEFGLRSVSSNLRGQMMNVLNQVVMEIEAANESRQRARKRIAS